MPRSGMMSIDDFGRRILWVRSYGIYRDQAERPWGSTVETDLQEDTEEAIAKQNLPKKFLRVLCPGKLH